LRNCGCGTFDNRILLARRNFIDLTHWAGIHILTSLVVPKTGGMNTTKVTVVRWLKKQGDALKQGDAIVELETDSPVNGVLLKIISREPAEVPVGGVLGYIGDPGDRAPES
jgi:pyruvate/2-oxoglutarate dehydrogenase complex dihydrolipoamide acyltransferase (E2) component